MARHYEVLGVTPDASMADIKRAYLTAARRAHPDLNRGDAQGAQRQMQAVNAAWDVLGDVDKRMAYDKARLSASTDPSPRSRPRPKNDSPDRSDQFVPFDDDDRDGFDERDDQAITTSALPPWTPIVPPAIVAAGLAMVLVGAVAQVGAIAAAGLIAMILGALGFVLLPIISVGVAARGDRNR